MRAAVIDRYGPPEVVMVRQEPDPSPGNNDVVFRVGAASVNSGDARMRAASFPPGFGLVARLGVGLRKPRRSILGVAVAGVIDSVGADVDVWQPGDRVTAMLGSRLGGHAELVRVDARRLVATPPAVSDEAAAAILFGGTTAWHFLHRVGRLTEGSTVMINGASGSVGLAAVQVARHAGAEVTAVTSGRNADLVKRLGATTVIDYTITDLERITGTYDIVLDTVGNLHSSDAARLLGDTGVLILAVGSLGETIAGSRKSARVRAGVVPERTEDIAQLLDLVRSGDLDPTIDAVYPLEQISQAHRHVSTGRKVGNIVIIC